MSKCIKCGQCCQMVRMSFNVDGETSEFMSFRAGVPMKTIVLTLPGNRCRYLTEDNLCSIYGTGKRHSYCREFDCHGFGIEPGLEVL